MDQKRERRSVRIIVFVFLLLLTLPFLFSSFPAHSEVPGGFLFNPIDGNSYLAKMRQGYEGSWLFTLPYTAEPGQGAAINLYYIFLGHVARIVGVPENLGFNSLLVTFHAARVLGALLLSLALYRFFAAFFVETGQRLLAFSLALFGSGLGWLAAGFGFFASDFWVAEAYPFLASYANPHFALGLALQVWLLTPLRSDAPYDLGRFLLMLVGAALLSLIYPFGWVLTIVVLTAWLVWQAWQRNPLSADQTRWVAVLVGGAPYALYAFLTINTHPVLSQWNVQNLTPAPTLLDLLISLSPLVLLAVAGIVFAFQAADNTFRFLSIWLVVGILILYVPINLQRRLISGLYVPVVGLAVFGLWKLISSVTLRKTAALAVLLLVLPTNGLVILGGIQAARQHNNPAINLNISELDAFRWLNENAPPDSLVLASPASGLLIPAYSSMRVIYGHPFETVDADLRLAEVSAFFSGAWSQDTMFVYLQEAGVDYVLYGYREEALGPLPELPSWLLVYDYGVKIWAHLP